MKEVSLLQCGEVFASLCWVGSTEDVVACYKDIGSCIFQLTACLQVHSAINLDESFAASTVEQLTQLSYFLQSVWDELLSAETWIDTHQQNQVDVGYYVLQYGNRSGRIERNTSFHTGFVNLSDNAMQVRASFVVDIHQIGSKFFYFVYELLGLHNHQMHIQRLLADASNMLQHGKPKGNVGHENAVHNIDVEPIGTALIEPLHLGLEIGEVGSEQ